MLLTGFSSIEIKMAKKIHVFPRTHRLGGRGAFAAVYSGGFKQSGGPLIFYNRPNSLPHNRWGLSVSRRIGIAARRNRLKRLLRESIRLLEGVNNGYDCVIVVRPHDPLTVPQYQQILSAVMDRAHQHWSRIPPTIS
jgi:ribonuclease P protein component